MNVAALLDKRRIQWAELENLCDAMEARGRTDKAGQYGAQGISRFSTLYRAACADLALADAYQLPPGTVTYLHRLVARAHNQLYRANKFEPNRWTDVVFREAPQQIFADPCVRVATIVFFGLFGLSMYMGANEDLFPRFAEVMVGAEELEGVEDMYAEPLAGSLSHYVPMAGFYIMHNTGIGLQCFALGPLLIPCLYKLAENAVILGTIFGYMARDDVVGGDNFFHFVTAHGPFELTAIALAAAAGLRLGVGLFNTRGLTRTDSVRESAMQAVPVMAASAVLFCLAAFTEGFLSPSPAPYTVKAAWAIMSSGLISFYFVILGFPRHELARPEPVVTGALQDVQLDQTHVVIRLRTLSEIGDLAMVMIRRYPMALLIGFALGALPWAIANAALLSWIPINESAYGLDDEEAFVELARYGVWMMLLVILQTPAAGVMTTIYLGQAVFEHQPTWASVFTEAWRQFKRWFWVLGVQRFAIPAMIVPLIRFGQPASGFWDVMVPMGFVIALAIVRSSRPFMPEILLLEQCPLRSDSEMVITTARRSKSLHAPMASDLGGRFLAVAFVMFWLFLSVLYTFTWARGIATGVWAWDLLVLLVMFPLALWVVAGVSVLVRLLSYLDMRIRLEGWEVELAIRAEAMRQFGEEAGWIKVPGESTTAGGQTGQATGGARPATSPVGTATTTRAATETSL